MKWNESTIYEADSRALTSLFRCHSRRKFIAGPFIFPWPAQLQNTLVNREAYVNYANERRETNANGQVAITRKINAWTGPRLFQRATYSFKGTLRSNFPFRI